MAEKDEKTKKSETSQVWSFKGRFAEYMRELLGGGDDYKKIFDEIYHGYAFCAIYGLLKGRRHVYDAKVDNPSDSSFIIAFRWAYAANKGIFSYGNVRKLVLLYSKRDEESFDSKIDSALRFDYSSEDTKDPVLLEKSQYKKNSDLIDEYVLGGLELLHQKIDEISSREAMIVFMKETLEEIQGLMKLETDDN